MGQNSERNGNGGRRLFGPPEADESIAFIGTAVEGAQNVGAFVQLNCLAQGGGAAAVAGLINRFAIEFEIKPAIEFGLEEKFAAQFGANAAFPRGGEFAFGKKWAGRLSLLDEERNVRSRCEINRRRRARRFKGDNETWFIRLCRAAEEWQPDRDKYYQCGDIAPHQLTMKPPARKINERLV